MEPFKTPYILLNSIPLGTHVKALSAYQPLGSVDFDLDDNFLKTCSFSSRFGRLGLVVLVDSLASSILVGRFVTGLHSARVSTSCLPKEKRFTNSCHKRRRKTSIRSGRSIRSNLPLGQYGIGNGLIHFYLRRSRSISYAADWGQVRMVCYC